MKPDDSTSKLKSQHTPEGDTDQQRPEQEGFRQWLWRVIFLSDTTGGRAFDIILLAVILLCVLVVMLESVESLRSEYESTFILLEWTFTAIFAVEYITRLYVVRNRWKYATSFFGIIDLISILPSFFDLIFAGSHYLVTIRILRLLRMFRILKMAEHVGEAHLLIRALKASRRKIFVFLTSVLTLVCVEGTMMYVIEHEYNAGFSNIPQSVYWAVVTLTTVGYGDVSPITILGKLMASVIMLTGFAIIAVPTGVVTAELTREMRGSRTDGRSCDECGWNRHDPQARYCQQCGQALD